MKVRGWYTRAMRVLTRNKYAANRIDPNTIISPMPWRDDSSVLIPTSVMLQKYLGISVDEPDAPQLLESPMVLEFLDTIEEWRNSYPFNYYSKDEPDGLRTWARVVNVAQSIEDAFSGSHRAVLESYFGNFHHYYTLSGKKPDIGPYVALTIQVGLPGMTMDNKSGWRFDTENGRYINLFAESMVEAMKAHLEQIDGISGLAGGRYYAHSDLYSEEGHEKYFKFLDKNEAYEAKAGAGFIYPFITLGFKRTSSLEYLLASLFEPDYLYKWGVGII